MGMANKKAEKIKSNSICSSEPSGPYCYNLGFESVFEQNIVKLKEYFGEKPPQVITDDEKIALLLSYIDISPETNRRKDCNTEMVSSGVLKFLHSKLPTEVKYHYPEGFHEPLETHKERPGPRLKKKMMAFLQRPSILKSSDTLPVKHQARCMGILGRAYEEGLFSLERSLKNAIMFYRWAVTLGCPMATYRLARCSEKGIGIAVDLEKASYLYRISYKLGYTPAIHHYALILIRGSTFISRDIMNGYHLLRLAVEKSNREYPYPYYDFGLFHTIKNDYIPLDLKYAFRIFLKGARLGCNRCQFQVAKYYESGSDVVKRNVKQSFVWYNNAARNGHTEAQYLVSRMLFNKNVYMVGTSMCSAIDYGKFYARGTDLYRRAFVLATEAANHGHMNATLLVAKALEGGVGVERNILLSLWYYRIAVAQGLKSAEAEASNIEKGIAPSICMAKKKEPMGLLAKIISFIS